MNWHVHLGHAWRGPNQMMSSSLMIFLFGLFHCIGMSGLASSIIVFYLYTQTPTKILFNLITILLRLVEFNAPTSYHLLLPPSF